jgi:hypothetical protein
VRYRWWSLRMAAADQESDRTTSGVRDRCDISLVELSGRGAREQAALNKDGGIAAA